jgi:hypothetical protein
MREMQIKTTLRYHLAPARIAIIKKQKIRNVGKDVEKRAPCTLLVAMQMSAAKVENGIQRLLKKGTRNVPYYLAILLLGIYPKELKSESQKDICTHAFIMAIVIIADIWKILTMNR